MATSQFDPIKDALPYKNGKFKFKVGPATVSVLCGGISYTALDYFETGIRPPQSPGIPVDGNPMEEYLYRRQETAHFYTWHRFANAWTFEIESQDDINELDQYLSSRPVIICLFGGFGHGHHVVATACDVGRGEITLYDSNHPGLRSFITQTEDGKWLHSNSGEKWRGWFMDWGHYNDGTRMPPLAFKYCRKCHNLHTPSLGSSGSCVGGGHQDNPTLEYFLPWQPGKGQPGWKVCGNCLGLYREDGSTTPVCPGGGVHFPQSLSNCWQDLSIATDGAGETGWTRCANCTSLCWNNNGDLGSCAGGGMHSSGGERYVLDARTVG